MHDMGLWLSFSTCQRQLSFALPKPLYSNCHLISVRPQVVCKVYHGKIRERSFHLTQKNAKYFRRVHLLHPLLLTGLRRESEIKLFIKSNQNYLIMLNTSNDTKHRYKLILCRILIPEYDFGFNLN